MSQVDLSALRIDESALRPRPPIGPRLLGVAVLLLLGAAAMTFLVPLLRPARRVPTVPIRAVQADASASVTAVAEAVGWVEPDPFPVVIKPLVAGRIEAIHVLEGDEVTAGDTVLATLQSADLLAAHERAQATLAERDAEVAVAAANLAKATAHRDQHAEHRTAVAEAQVTVSDKETRLAVARATRARLVAEARGADAAATAQDRLSDAGSGHPVALERARAASAAALAAVATADAEIAALDREVSAARTLLSLRQELRDDAVDLEWAVRVATAELTRGERARASAAVQVAIAERELGWAKAVRSPVSGTVLRLLAAPGETTGPGGAGVVAVYDPKKLRARIDVPLDSVGSVAAGQRVELRSEVTATTVVHGVVQRLQHETDLLKNTLQVKIALLDPPAIWRPETLCRARFLATQATAEARAQPTFSVPRAAVQAGKVFVFDPAQRRARAVAVTVVREVGDQVLITGDLSVTQRAIVASVEDGETVAEQRP